MRRVSLAGSFTFLMAAASMLSPATAQPATASCAKPVYLTIDTGHMGVAPLMAEVLRRQDVRATFFAANEKTLDGGTSLDDKWAPWWRARAAEGHEFASHTWNHTYWRADVRGEAGAGAPVKFRVRASAGAQAGIDHVWTAAQYCEEIRHAASRLEQITGRPTLPLFRAPGGKTSPAFLAATRACGYQHVGWSPAGFLGDELPSESHSNASLLAQALKNIRAGDILLAHLGIWSRKDAWAPVVLEPLVEGLKARGFCFRALSEHPDYARWTAPGNAANSPAAPGGKR